MLLSTTGAAPAAGDGAGLVLAPWQGIVARTADAGPRPEAGQRPAAASAATAARTKERAWST